MAGIVDRYLGYHHPGTRMLFWNLTIGVANSPSIASKLIHWYLDSDVLVNEVSAVLFKCLCDFIYERKDLNFFERFKTGMSLVDIIKLLYLY